MIDLRVALAKLDETRARHRMAPLPPGLPEARVLEFLDTAGIHAHEHLVTWYSHYGSGPESLVPGIRIGRLDLEVGMYLDLCAVAEDWRDDPVAYSESVDWFPIARDFSRTVMWARECTGAPAMAKQNELSELHPTPTGTPVTLPELVAAWVTRLDLGYYTPDENGDVPWLKYRLAPAGAPRKYEDVLTDEVRLRSGL